MKISKVEVYTVTIPFAETTVVAYHTYTETLNVFVKVHTDEGIVGVGEASPAPAFTGETRGSILAALETIAPKIIGKDPFDIGAIHDIWKKYLLSNLGSKAALDMALYDIMGKTAQLPVYKLIGGCFRTDIPTQHLLPIKKPSEMAELAVELVNQGYKIFETKVGFEPQSDIDRIKAIRDAVGFDPILVVDANAGWSVTEAIKCLGEMEKYSILAEQPTRGIDGLAEVRRAVNVPIIADESAFTPEDAIEIIKKDACDIISIKLLKAGGFYQAIRIRAICETARMPYRIDDMIVSRLGNTASAHLAVSSGDAIACGVAQHTLLSDPGLIKKGGVKIDRGVARVPAEPGLSVELNDALLGKPIHVFK